MAYVDMKSTYLEPEEFQIECEIRHIPVTNLSVNILQDKLKAEQLFPLLIPRRPHIRAINNPEHEIKLCSLKLQRISNSFRSSTSSSPLLIHQIEVAESRILHYRERICRLQDLNISNLAPQIADLLAKFCTVLELVKGIRGNFISEHSSPHIKDDTERLQSVQPASSTTDVEPNQKEIQPDPQLLSFEPNTIDLGDSISNRQGSEQINNFDNSDIFELESLKAQIPSIEKRASAEPSKPNTRHDPTESRVPVENIYNPFDNSNMHGKDILLSRNTNESMSRSYPYENISSHSHQVAANNREEHRNNNSVSRNFVANENQASNEVVMPPIQHPVNRGTNRSSHPHHYYSVRTEASQGSRAPETAISRIINSWNLKFGGTLNDLPIDRFLFRLEFLAQASNIPLTSLIDHLGSILVGNASEWYWTYLERHRFQDRSWNRIKTDLIERFNFFRSDRDIKRAMDNRKQKPREKFVDFQDAILKIALQAKTPIPDWEILEVLKDNMEPQLQILLANRDIRNITRLAFECNNLEDIWARVGNNPPVSVNRSIPRFNVHELSNTLVETVPIHHNPTPNDSQYMGDEHMLIPDIQAFSYRNDSSRVNSKQSGVQFDRSQLKCWNCKHNGHSYRYCRSRERNLFCTMCGQENVMFVDCSRCNQSGNQGNPQGRNLELRDPILQNRHIPTKPPCTITESASNTDPEFYKLLRRPK